MSYSMLMASVMMDFTGEEVITQCVTMGLYLLGLGGGSLLGDRIKVESRLKSVWNFEWASVLLLPLIPLFQLLLIFFFLQFTAPGTKLDSLFGLAFLLGVNGIFSFISGVLGGAQLPLILKLQSSDSEEKILAVNYLGPLFAGILVVGMTQSAQPLSLQIYFIGLIQILGLVFLLGQFQNRLRYLILLVPLIFVLFGAASLTSFMEKATVKTAYLGMKTRPSDFLNPGPIFNVLEKYGSVERRKTPYQTIDLFIEPPELTYSIPGNASLYLNRKPQFDLFSADLYHESMIFGAFNLLGRTPQNILILGAGDGLLLRELKRTPTVKSITLVELDPVMIEWSTTNGVISQLNRNVFEDLPANTQIIVGDGVSFLRTAKTKYDLILVDFPFPNGHDLAKLYSYEFYRLVLRTLTSDGLLVLDLPLYLSEKNVLAMESRVILKTLRAAGFEKPLLFGPSASFVAVSSSKKKLGFDYQKFPSDLTMSTYFNLLTPYREEDIPDSEWKTTQTNSMFWPRGL